VLFWQSSGLLSQYFAGVERNLVAPDECSRTACRVYINMQSGF
jgi:hypothetical protein